MPFPHKTSLAILFFGALILLLGMTKLMRPPELVSVLDFQPRFTPAAAQAELPLPPPGTTAMAARRPLPVIRAIGQAPVQLIDPAGSMRAFYAALDRAAAGEGVTRVLHYGDSPVTADSITASS
jgi:hypothetical protein